MLPYAEIPMKQFSYQALCEVLLFTASGCNGYKPGLLCYVAVNSLTGQRLSQVKAGWSPAHVREKVIAHPGGMWRFPGTCSAVSNLISGFLLASKYVPQDKFLPQSHGAEGTLQGKKHQGITGTSSQLS